MASNFSSHVFYFAASRFFSAPSLFYGRLAKAIAMAFLAPLICFYAINRLQLSRAASAITALMAVLLPGVVAFSWIATEYTLDLVFGFTALVLFLSPNIIVKVLSGPALGLTALSYGEGLLFIPLMVAEYLLFLWKQPSPRAFSLIGTCVGFAAATLAIPGIWWRNSPMLFLGGGRIEFDIIGKNFRQLFQELSIQGGSYYYFSKYPALSCTTIIALCSIGFLLSIRQFNIRWPLYLGFFTALGMYCVSGGAIGIRRNVFIVIIAVLFAGCFLDAWLRWAFFQTRNMGIRLAAIVLVLLCFELPVKQYLLLRKSYESGEIRLPIDFKFERIPGMTMVQTIDFLKDHPDVLSKSAQAYELDRTLSILYFKDISKLTLLLPKEFR